MVKFALFLVRADLRAVWLRLIKEFAGVSNSQIRSELATSKTSLVPDIGVGNSK